jgi:hypothetical protein
VPGDPECVARDILPTVGVELRIGELDGAPKPVGRAASEWRRLGALDAELVLAYIPAVMIVEAEAMLGAPGEPSVRLRHQKEIAILEHHSIGDRTGG